MTTSVFYCLAEVDQNLISQGKTKLISERRIKFDNLLIIMTYYSVEVFWRMYTSPTSIKSLPLLAADYIDHYL